MRRASLVLVALDLLAVLIGLGLVVWFYGRVGDPTPLSPLLPVYLALYGLLCASMALLRSMALAKAERETAEITVTFSGVKQAPQEAFEPNPHPDDVTNLFRLARREEEQRVSRQSELAGKRGVYVYRPGRDLRCPRHPEIELQVYDARTGTLFCGTCLSDDDTDTPA